MVQLVHCAGLVSLQPCSCCRAWSMMPSHTMYFPHACLNECCCIPLPPRLVHIYALLECVLAGLTQGLQNRGQ